MTARQLDGRRRRARFRGARAGWLAAMLTVGGLSPTDIRAGEPAEADLWAAVHVTTPLIVPGRADDPRQINFVLVNDGAQTVDPKIEASGLFVNGRPLETGLPLFSNGPRDARFTALPPGETLRFGSPLGEPFTKPGVYRIRWVGERFRSEEIVLRVLPIRHTFTPDDLCEAHRQVDHAREQGELEAEVDLVLGTAVILHYGKPWSGGRPLVDEATGLPVEIVAGCAISPAFVAWADAYNRTVRDRFRPAPEAEAAAEIPGKAPAPTDYSGPWRMLLPAGFEQHVTLESAGDGLYRLGPLSFVMGGIYEREGDRLVWRGRHLEDGRITSPEDTREGTRFAWAIRSPYLMTLVEEGPEADKYRDAILFRTQQESTRGASDGPDGSAGPKDD